MDYLEDIKKSIDFIDLNINKKITLKMIADNVCYSVYHFSRVFKICTDFTVMEYVRKRRLELALKEKENNKKIIDIAFEMGYKTQSGFAKAFHKEYGKSINKYIKNNELNRKGEIKLEPIIIKKEEFKIAGYGVKTDISSGRFTKDVAASWEEYDKNGGVGWEGRLHETLNPPKHCEVGICVPSNNKDENLIYIAGTIIDSFENVTDDMQTLIVPKATYAIFTTKPLDSNLDANGNSDLFANEIRRTWKYIFEEWLPNSKYQYDEDKLDYEYYDERCHTSENCVMEIHIPIK